MPLHYKCPCGKIYREDSMHGCMCPESNHPRNPIATRRDRQLNQKPTLMTDGSPQSDMAIRELRRAGILFEPCPADDGPHITWCTKTYRNLTGVMQFIKIYTNLLNDK